MNISILKSLILKDSDGLKTVQVQGITNKKTQFINLSYPVELSSPKLNAYKS